MNEQELIAGLRSGDQVAYRWLYIYHYTTLCKYAGMLIKDAFTAETIVNEVFTSIWKHRSQIEIISLRGYLLRSTKNRCLNYISQQARQEKFANEYKTYLRSHQEVFQGNSADLIESLLVKELDTKIVQALSQLPELTRSIFELSRFSDLKYHEIAEQLHVSVDVVKYHIKRALNHLRKELSDYFKKI